MPLDTGAVVDDLDPSWAAEQGEVLWASMLNDGQHIGDALRLVREFKGLTIEDLARATRVRRHYLQSIEDLRLDQLPSRPFTIGYVRAYAVALGLDGDRAVARFRRDAPDPDEPLRAPVGVSREADPRLMVVAICGAVVICGILAWNFAERAMSRHAAPSAVVASAPVKAPPPSQGPVTVGAPLPAPQESTTPKPFLTQGLPRADSDASAAPSDAEATAAGLAQDQPIGAPFVANGEVYGDVKAPGAIILQARGPASITVHRADGSIAFARFLSAGQAYVASPSKGGTVEVSEPASVDIFVGGVLKGPMASTSAPIASLAGADE